MPKSEEHRDPAPPASTGTGQDKPFWVILEPLGHFVSGHDTLTETEAQAQHLDAQARLQGRPPRYGTKPRPYDAE